MVIIASMSDACYLCILPSDVGWIKRLRLKKPYYKTIHTATPSTNITECNAVETHSGPANLLV